MRTIRWGIIGCGDVTEVKSGPGFQKATNSALVAVMRRDGSKAQDYAKRHDVPRWYDSAEALIGDGEVDAVYVATPPQFHEHYTMLTAEAGKPVYVEKPMARSFPECQRMVSACQSAGVPLFVAYYRRCLPRFVKVKELLDGGAIGDVRFVSVTLYQPPSADELTGDAGRRPWRVDPMIAGGGKFVDLASHTLDLLDHFFGPILYASAGGRAKNQGAHYSAEDIVASDFEFKSGIVGTGVWCFSAATHADRVEIVGSKGTMTFASFANDPVRVTNASGTQDFHVDHPPHVQQPLIQTVVDELIGIGRCPSTGVSAARTNRVMDAMLKAWRRKTGQMMPVV